MVLMADTGIGFLSEVDKDQTVFLLALGNTLRQQDGFGPALLDYLKQHYQFPTGLVALSAGINPLSYYPMIIACRWLILVDAVNPGETKAVERNTGNDASAVLLRDPYNPGKISEEKISSHGLSADSLLALLDTIGQKPPRVTLLGLVMSTSDLDYMGGQFSPELLQLAAEKLERLLEQEGMPMSRSDKTPCL
jgi:hydrogenase maturation protease